ncbi:site-specific integrase [Vibrio sp. 10N.261.51.A3]|uniref:site-specific integrase n=1 Tax=unclassified Vibrio TaxID=2614977 RepID=UPI00354C2723
MNLSTVTNSIHLNYNPNIVALELDLPIQKSKKNAKAMTSYELLDAYTKSRTQLASANLKNIQEDHQRITKTLGFLDFTDLKDLDYAGSEAVGKALTYLPANSEKYAELKGLFGFELVAKNYSLPEPYPCISQSTKKGYIQKFSSFLKWAKRHGYVDDNVFYKLPIGKVHEGKKRFPFDGEQLTNIFSMPDYSEHKYLHPYYYWVPLIQRYSALRLNEVCQFDVTDIKKVDGIDCFLVQQVFDGQRVKTESSIRVVPIHDELKKKGFLSFVESKKSGRLFPELTLVKGYYSNNASKWFARRRKKLGLGKGFDAHSFRHTFINELKQKEVSKEIIECIVGHSHESESFDTYSYQYSPAILASVVNMIDTSHTASVLPYMQKKAAA